MCNYAPHKDITQLGNGDDKHSGKLDLEHEATADLAYFYSQSTPHTLHAKLF